jgi:tetratricopeptide (TPR) repeat protein
MSVEWFRNRTWNDAVERTFNEKLRRARRKEQYLRIQASTLAVSCPEVALKLLDRYFELQDDFDHAQAHVDRATALLALGRVNDAMAAYEAALRREAVFPNLKTQAYLELPFLIATRGIREQYDRALHLLHAHEGRLMFAVDHFRWHAATAFIAADSQQHSVARLHAERALEAASCEHSGLRYHPTVGLVSAQYGSVISKLEAYSAA